MIEYPYLPKGKEFLFVPETNRFMKKAKRMVEGVKKKFPFAGFVTASVIVKDGAIVSKEVNQDVHFSFCPRRVFDSPSGQDYELCPRHCHPDNHSEARAIKKAGEFAKNADLYMCGHWWCCKPCWDKMLKTGIKNVFLVENAAEKFYYEPDKRKAEQPRVLRYNGNVPEELASLLVKVNVMRNESTKSPDFLLKYGDDSAMRVSAKGREQKISFTSVRDLISQLSRTLEDMLPRT